MGALLSSPARRGGAPETAFSGTISPDPVSFVSKEAPASAHLHQTELHTTSPDPFPFQLDVAQNISSPCRARNLPSPVWWCLCKIKTGQCDIPRRLICLHVSFGSALILAH